jgi:Fur family ferric uptake transcriptional regulator
MMQVGRKCNCIAIAGLAPRGRLAHLVDAERDRPRQLSPMVRALKQPKTPAGAAPSVAELQAEIRRHGLRSTGARVAVLAHLKRAQAPLSHTEIYEALEDRGYDRATIYRNLMDLADAGMLMRSDLGDHVWRFELKKAKAGHSEAHPHFVCVDCGEVTCLPDLAVKVMPASGAPKALRNKQVEVQVKGRCDDCT